MTWICPYCQQNATLINTNQSVKDHDFIHNTVNGWVRLRTILTICPNEECRQYTINAFLYEIINSGTYNNGRALLMEKGSFIDQWALRPLSSARGFPDYIPIPIINDYNEACAIRDLSPKASATLSRRCLQGIIRDFWGISKNRLIDEIAAIREKIDPVTWNAIDAIRKVGNIGAHMEKDIDVIIDVDPQEAQLLIALIEILFKDWYITRYERQKQLEDIISIATRIEEAKQ